MNVQSDGLTVQESEAGDQLVKLDSSAYKRERCEFFGGKLGRQSTRSWRVKDFTSLFGRT